MLLRPEVNKLTPISFVLSILLMSPHSFYLVVEYPIAEMKHISHYLHFKSSDPNRIDSHLRIVFYRYFYFSDCYISKANYRIHKLFFQCIFFIKYVPNDITRKWVFCRDHYKSLPCWTFTYYMKWLSHNFTVPKSGK